MPAVNLPTDDELRSAGGWQAVQEARKLIQMGAVRSVDASEAPEKISGQVLVGGTERRVILRWNSTRDARVSCSCATAKRGVLCGHGFALVLAARSGLPSASTVGGDTAKPGSAIRVKSPEPGGVGGSAADDVRPVRLRVPAQFRKSWEMGALPVLFEVVAAAETGRTLPMHALLSGLRPWLGLTEVLPPAIRLEGGAAGEFLRWLSGKIEVLTGPEGEIFLAKESCRPSLKVEFLTKSAEKVRLRSVLEGGGAWVKGPPGWWMHVGGGTARLVGMELSTDQSPGETRGARESRPWSDPVTGGDARAPFSSVVDALDHSGEIPQGLLPLFDPTRSRTVEMTTTEFLRLAGPLSAVAHLDTTELAFELISDPPEIHLHLDGSVAEIRCTVSAAYPEGPPIALPMVGEGDFPRASREKSGRFWLRDEAAERSALAQLEKWGFLQAAGSVNSLILRGENLVLTWIASMGRLLPDDWRVVSSERWQRTLATVEVAKFRFEGASSGEGWLEGELACATDSGLTISRADLHRLLRTQRGHFQTSGGRRVVVDLGLAGEIEEVLRDVGADQSSPGHFRFRREQLAYVQETLQPSGAGGTLGIPPLDGESVGPVWDLLRPYQQTGVTWLAAQAGHALGSVLADDMGLGKTLQTLVFLEWQRRQGAAGPALVVCPTSLLGSWRDEAARFFPAWRVLVQHGQKRNQDWDVLDAADLVLTSYALVSRDADRYREHEFRAIVLDEASLIRNPDSLMAKAAHGLRGRVRVALTGTPVENSVRDLWSVARFVQPGYLGTRDDFKMRYEKSVAAGDKAAAARLQRRLKPLLLRRLKSDVARDLPARLENTAWCELEGEQAALYQAVLRESRDKVADAIKKEGFARARMSVLTALLRLRQICCDPGLVGIETGPGAKRELFRERLREALEGGHRVLVFSQFTSMLERLREDVRESGIEPCWLTGASQDRAEQVRAFQEGTSPIFLLSLKAGGYGLTLTAADTVFLYDPWWNPAVEAQAIDRAHRIGQAKVVNAYRFAARGTVEEKILRLQEKKRMIAEQTLGAEDDLEAAGDSDLRELLGV